MEKKNSKIESILSDRAIKVLEHQEKIFGGANGIPLSIIIKYYNIKY
ncbi:MAG: hypothetical protein LBV69_07890 [Bacteroidales bacterium]|jgi:hypothetical protein|nr:hypothetical protein [Bacteroidales bacterium]